MKRLVTLFAALSLVLCLAGCAAPAGVAEDGKVKIVATIWPEYEWTKAVLGDNPAGAELTLLFVAMAVAFIVSILVIRFLMDYIKKHDFKAFGVYRILIGIVVLVLVPTLM